ncbi:hypothetical protein H072_5740 [Dactylellina haptotyla CBS 200.50]|uniref:Uncharacterized protein n=1 Tax=Dactylellina haptotyla (strain CBS 200.50) TaxID=1284197 RepID=S8ABT1_DACHA|nr:hypothetical protein H072_5740 [Dactylellina haptotyla CBS 200.50]
MCIGFVVETKPKAKSKTKAEPPLNEFPESARPKVFFNARSGQFLINSQIDKEIGLPKLIDAAPYAPQQMSLPTNKTRHKTDDVFLISGASGPHNNFDMNLQTSTDGGASLGLKKPRGKGYATPEEAIQAALKSGFRMDNKNIHIMPGERGGYFVVGVSDK